MMKNTPFRAIGTTLAASPSAFFGSPKRVSHAKPAKMAQKVNTGQFGGGALVKANGPRLTYF